MENTGMKRDKFSKFEFGDKFMDTYTANLSTTFFRSCGKLGLMSKIQRRLFTFENLSDYILGERHMYR